MNLIQKLEQEEIQRLKRNIPDFAPGDTVLVLGPDSSVSPLIFAAIIPLTTVNDPATRIAPAEGRVWDNAGTLIAHGSETCIIMAVPGAPS